MADEQIKDQSAKTTLHSNDRVPLDDSEASWASKYITGLMLKSQVNSYIAGVVTTFTNKRVTPRVVTVTVNATPTYNTDNGDIFRIGVTGDLLDLAITSMTTNLSGTPTHGQKIIIEFLDDGTGRAIAWGASFRSTDVSTLPTTTTASKLLRVGLMYDSVDTIWDCLAKAEEA